MLSLRICIWTEYGPIGPRLERGGPLPRYEQSYPDTEEGRQQATEDMERVAKYVSQNNKTKKTK